MQNQIIEKLFDSPVKVKLLKLFLRNDDTAFSGEEIILRTQLKARQAKKELEKLEAIHFLKTKFIKSKSGKRKIKTKKVLVYAVNHNFLFYPELKNLVLKSSPASEERVKNDIKKLGRVKLAVLTGLFINNESSRADLILVGNNINSGKLKRFLGNLEAETGKEIRYVVFSVEEFNYRLGMFDRFIKDILDYPHRKIINKLRI